MGGLKMLHKSLKEKEIGREIIATLLINYHVGPTSILVSMRDRAATYVPTMLLLEH